MSSFRCRNYELLISTIVLEDDIDDEVVEVIAEELASSSNEESESGWWGLLGIIYITIFFKLDTTKFWYLY
jgi:hypothetical protein